MDRKYGYVYITTNKISGKIYIGQKHSHKFIESYLGSGHILHDSIKRYGNDNFETHIISFYDSADELDEAEKYWIKKYNSQNREIGYNISEGGIWGKCEYTKEEKEILSKKLSKSIQNFYKTETEEHKKERLAKLKGKNLGRKASIEARQKMSKAAKGRKSCNKGKITVFKNDICKYINKNELEYYESIGYKRGNPFIIKSNKNRVGSIYKRYIVKLNNIIFETTYTNLRKDILEHFGVCPEGTILKIIVRTGKEYHPYQLKFRCLTGLTIQKEVISNHERTYDK